MLNKRPRNSNPNSKRVIGVRGEKMVQWARESTQETRKLIQHYRITRHKKHNQTRVSRNS